MLNCDWQLGAVWHHNSKKLLDGSNQNELQSPQFLDDITILSIIFQIDIKHKSKLLEQKDIKIKM